jgi:hypothetical protein
MRDTDIETFDEIPIGAEIFTRDNDQIGRVREVRGDHFKVSVARQPDYWLPQTTIASTEGNVITLTFTRTSLNDFKQSEPQAA